MIEYIPAEINPGTLFTISKFDGGEQPEAVYFILYDKKKNEMRCDCPNRRRAKHINDKHGQMIAKWLLAGRKPGHFDEKGEFHENLDASPLDQA